MQRQIFYILPVTLSFHIFLLKSLKKYISIFSPTVCCYIVVFFNISSNFIIISPSNLSLFSMHLIPKVFKVYLCVPSFSCLQKSCKNPSNSVINLNLGQQSGIQKRILQSTFIQKRYYINTIYPISRG